MKLKSFGCSMIFGTDLSDYLRHIPPPSPPSKRTWPAHVAKQFEWKYQCLARPGSGNLQIAEKVLSELASDPEPSYYVIGWTWIDRFDYINDTVEDDPDAWRWRNWNTLMPVDKDKISRTYFRELHSEYKDKLCSLMYIKLVIDTLKQRQMPYVMTYLDPLLFDQRWNVNSAVLDLQKYVKPHMIDFEGVSFLEWSKLKGFEISNTMHPLDQAHKSAADYMINFFDTQKTNDPVQQVHV